MIWLEEGNGAALFELPDADSEFQEPQLIAVIPPWSGLDGFHGYAANCINETSVCWPMPDNPLLMQRIDSAREFWESWGASTSDSDGKAVPASPFAIQQPAVLANYRERFGIESGEEKYYAAGGDQFPLRGLLHHRTDRLEVIVTAGMSVCPQPAVEMFVDDPANFRRIELALVLPKQIDQNDSTLLDALTAVMEQLSGLSGYPWQQLTWFRDGHTCSFQFGEYSALLLIDDASGSRLAGVDSIALPEFRGDPVNLLWMLPMTDSQLTQLKEKKLAVGDLVEQWVAV